MTFTISNFLYLYVWRFSEGAFAALPWLLMVSVMIAFVVVQPLHHRFGKKKVAVVCGVISTIWTELECLRARWIAARLRSEGFSSTAQDVGPWYDRLQALEEQAPTVAVLWSDGPTAQSR